MTEMVVSFYKLDDTGGDLDMVQFHGVPFVPAVGEKCFVWTSRDSEGNYSPDGKPRRRWNGMVVKREFSYEIQGKDSAHYRSVIYVDVYVDCAEATSNDKQNSGTIGYSRLATTRKRAS